MSTSSAAQFERSPTRILRDKGIDPSIKCTSTLVANYNAEEDTNVREAMRIWLDTHIEEFSKISTGSIQRETIVEFMHLAEIKVKGSADEELVRRVYTTIRQVVTRERKDCQVYYVLALGHILSTVDDKILQDDAATLFSLANCLIEMTDLQNGPLTRATYDRHASCLTALERVLMLLHDLDKNSPEQYTLKFFEDKVKKHLSKIIKCQHYYPLEYQAFLIKENIKTIKEKDTKSLLINAGRRAFYAFCGGLYIFQGARELAVLKFDFSAMESGIGKFREAFKDIGWYSMTEVQEIISAASEAVENDAFEIFQHYCDIHQKVSWWDGLKWSKKKMIRYTLVTHLCLFCTKNCSRSSQDQALDLLVRLATKDEGKRWRNDEQIFEAIIEALIAVGRKNQDYEHPIINTLEAITCSQNTQQEKVIDGLLHGKSADEVIKGGCVPQEDDNGCVLFTRTRQRLGLHRTTSIYNRNQETLKEYYMDDSFAKVSLFSDKNDQHHIKTFHFNLVEYEEVVVFRDRIDQTSQDNYNQQENNQQRTMKVKKSIHVKNLFEKRMTLVHGCHEDAQCLLVIGNPGTGKTCLSKRLCYDWVNGSWGTRFTHVYLLPIRRLNETSVGVDVDLPIIIRQIIYKISGTHDSNKSLYEEIKDNLSDATTLLILDGYDEASEMAMNLVTSAFTLNCSKLILSRPHGVDDLRPRVDNEVECLEFTCKQLETFIHKQLKSCDANDLLNFFSRNLSIRDTCCVAVNAQIITRLWNSSYKEELTKSSCANLANFYYMTSKYIWTRFTNKEDKFDANKTFDSLELIAFESFQKGQVEIPEHLVFKHAQESMKVFCASGFMLFVKEGSVFQFAHLTFHEYFAGRHVAKLLKSINDQERKKAKRFISEHKYIETSRVMLSFMIQCYCMRDDIEANLEAFKDLMQVLESDPLPTISLQHLLLRMRTLDAFLPCGLDETEVHTNDDVMLIVNDAMGALGRWFGYETYDIVRKVLVNNFFFHTSIVDELARMPNLFNNFPDLLKPILLNETAKNEHQNGYRRDVARVTRLNPQYALQCILPKLDNWTIKEQICMIYSCILIGPRCAESTLDHLKRLCKDQDFETRERATQFLGTCLDSFPKREDLRKLIVNAFEDPNRNTCVSVVRGIAGYTLSPKSNTGTFLFDLLIKATKHKHAQVRSIALILCVQHYQTYTIPVLEMMELVRKFSVSQDLNDRRFAAIAVKKMMQKAPENLDELLDLINALCKDLNEGVRNSAINAFLNIEWNPCLRRKDLFKMALVMFKDGYPNVQLKLLPFLFSFDRKESHGMDGVDELIATCQDLGARVQEKVDSCSKANAMLSNCTIEDLHAKFHDQVKSIQMEVVRQFDMREIASVKAPGAITEMAVHCLQYDQRFGPSLSLLEKLSKIELLPSIVLERLAKEGKDYIVQQQPLSHLLECYWMTKDPNMIENIAEKLLVSAAIFERKGKAEMVVSFREKGASVEQIAPNEVVQDFLLRCKGFLKSRYGLDFYVERN